MAFMAIQRFSHSRSSFSQWSGGLCNVDFSSDSFDAARSGEFGGDAASLDATVFSTVCQFGVRRRSVELDKTFRLPPLRACWVDPIVDIAGSPLALRAAHTGLFTLLNCTWGLPPDSREFVYRFICEEAADAARRAIAFRHDALAIRVTVKVVAFVVSDGPASDDEEESVFWEEAVAGAGEGACAVCLEEMEEGKTVARLRCGHAFDESCISRWLKRRMQCPLCRSDVEEIA